MSWKLTRILALSLFFSGCGGGSSEMPPGDAETTTRPATFSASKGALMEHGHIDGAHGGSIVPIGRDSYHAEAVFEKGGRLHLYMLGQDEAKVMEVPVQTLRAHASTSGADAVEFDLVPTPQSGDAEGHASKFLGMLPESMRGAQVTVTIPSLRIGSERFRFAFTSPREETHATSRPDAVPEEEEASLFLTPGGIYSAADIAANENKTSSRKFAAFKAAHDLNPMVGDKVCPITLTKANPQVSWIIGGKEYEFCCPPCVDEFVKRAKETPEEVKDPSEYVKK